jgi:L-threonate 2-dehydrogenase
MNQSVGLIGLGRIGQQLALNLLAAGTEVIGCDLAPRPRFVQAGGVLAATPRQVTANAQIIIQALPGADALREVLDGRDGLIESCGRDHVIADLGFYQVVAKRAAADRLRESGAILLDCQITGTPEMLARRAGSIFISGDAGAAGRCRPIFAAALDRHVFVSADFGAATTLKIANNLLVALNTAAAAEALALAVGRGIDPNIALEVMGNGAGQSQMFSQRAPLMVRRDYPGVSSTLRSFAVYLDAIEDELGRSKRNALLAKAALQIYRRALADGRGAEDMACVYEVVSTASSGRTEQAELWH